MFYGCNSLTEVELPANATSIGEEAFFGCSALTELEIPAGVTEIGKDAFKDCPNLTVTVAAGSYAEQYCKNNGVKYTTK